MLETRVVLYSEHCVARSFFNKSGSFCKKMAKSNFGLIAFLLNYGLAGSSCIH